MTRRLRNLVSALAYAIYVALMGPGHLFMLTDEGTLR